MLQKTSTNKCFLVHFARQCNFDESILTPSVVALSAVTMEYIHTPAFVNLDGPAADVKRTSM